MSSELWRLGEQYVGGPLDPANCDPDPVVEVKRWMQLAIDAQIKQPNAMTLATVDERGRPAARIVLLKEVDARGFVFFTNYQSRKGTDLVTHPFAALVLFWEPQHRQIRVEGEIEKLEPEASDAYFASRPRGSQVGAIASPQSQVIESRDVLQHQVDAVEAKLAGAAPERPANWGGYRLVADAVELWQGQPSRLHDRVKYTRTSATAPWTRARLAP